MPLFERSAIERCQRQLAPFADPGEQVQDFDIAWVGRAKFDLIATDRNVWIIPKDGQTMAKLPYEDFESALWQPVGGDGILSIAMRDGRAMMLEIRAPRGLAPDLQRRIEGKPEQPTRDVGDQPSPWS
jgi:hypothetical protein